MVTTRLTGSFKIILVASRDYLDARGIPKSVTDLYQHNCIGFRSIFSGEIFDWELFDGKEPVKVKTSGTALVTDTTEALSLALVGSVLPMLLNHWRADTLARAGLNGCCRKQRSNMRDCFSTIHGALPWRASG